MTQLLRTARAHPSACGARPVPTGLTMRLWVALAIAALIPTPSLQAAELFSWPDQASQLFTRITSLPRQDVVAQIRAVVEPVTKDTLSQITPEVVRRLTETPREDVVKFVVGILEPATKTVVSGVSGIVDPVAAQLKRLLEASRERLHGGVRGVLRPAAEGLGAVAGPALDEIILVALDGVRMIWRNNFEPLTVDHLELHLRDPLLTADVKLDEVQVNNASTFVVEEVRSEPHNMAVNFTVHVEAFNVTGYYDMDGVLSGEQKVFGAGNITVVVRGLRVYGRVVLGVKDLFLHVDDLALDISIETLKLEMDRLLGEGPVADLAGGVVSDVAPDFLEEFRPEVGAIIAGQIKEFANQVLGAFSIPSILERLKTHSENTASKRLRAHGRPFLYHHQQLEAERERILLEQIQERQRERQDKLERFWSPHPNS